jgi:hypothetical protein
MRRRASVVHCVFSHYAKLKMYLKILSMKITSSDMHSLIRASMPGILSQVVWCKPPIFDTLLKLI